MGEKQKPALPYDKAAGLRRAVDHGWDRQCLRLAAAAEFIGATEPQIKLAVSTGVLKLSQAHAIWWHCCRIDTDELFAMLRDDARTLVDAWTAAKTPEPTMPQKAAQALSSRAEVPSRRVGDGHLYLVEFLGHCVKVGISSDPISRVASHFSDGRKFGRDVGRVWVSYRHDEASENERKIKGRSKTEYLHRSFDELVDVAQQLKMTRAEVVAHG